jgi:tetratricopeptide (TPR) repeat protein
VIDDKKALNFGFEALELNKKGEISSDLMNINSEVGEILFYSKNYVKSIEYYNTSLKIHQLLPGSEKEHIYINKPPWILIALGNLYYTNKRFYKAEEIYLEAIENFNLFEEEFVQEKLNGLVTSENNLALVYSSLENYTQAEKSFKKVLEIRKKTNSVPEIMYQYMLLTNFYFQYNKIDLALYYYDLANILYKESFTLSTTTINPQIKIWYAYVLVNYGSHLRNKKQYKEALAVLYKGKEIVDDFELKPLIDDIPYIDVEIAQCLIELKQYKKAEKSLLESLDSSFYIMGSNDDYKIELLNILAQVYNTQNKLTKLVEVKDSIIKTYAELGKINFNSLENQLILNDKEKEINENNIKYYQYIALISVGILFSIIIIISLLSRFKIQKEKNSRLELEKKDFLNKIESKNRELTSKANFILQRNEYLKNIKAKLIKSEVNEKSFRRIEKEISELLNSEKSYEEFDKIFTKVYPKFYEILIKKT